MLFNVYNIIQCFPDNPNPKTGPTRVFYEKVLSNGKPKRFLSILAI